MLVTKKERVENEKEAACNYQRPPTWHEQQQMLQTKTQHDKDTKHPGIRI